MSGDLFSRKTNSPQSSTEISSLQVNRLKNKEGKAEWSHVGFVIALEKRLKCRPPIKELVNQGILPNRKSCLTYVIPVFVFRSIRFTPG